MGVWRLEVPGTQCHEIYTFHTDGTGFVTSAGQVARTHFAIDDQPSAGGFYRWVDQIVDDNGKPDCTGAVMEIGHVATNFIFLLTPGDAFVICRDASLDRCLGPLRRVRTDT
ncbi:MAG: hypothetical protein MUF30_06825 [Burkholderiales bacterium]|nr:hypothetical protein [Burkholderiales bacterium]